MHFKANVKGDTSNQPLKHYMQVFAPIYSHRSILVKICDRRSISLLLHPACNKAEWMTQVLNETMPRNEGFTSLY